MKMFVQVKNHILAALLITLFSVFALADGIRCGSLPMPSAGTMSWCLTPGSNDRHLIFFHGIMDNEHSWEKMEPQSLVRNIRAFGQTEPTVLTVSMGPIFFLTGRVLENGKTDVQEVSETLLKLLAELKLPNPQTHPGYYDLMGDSMGGHNSLHVFLRNPSFFRRYGLICPANVKVSPFSSFDNWLSNREHESAEWFLSVGLRQMLQFFYRDASVWHEQSPLQYLARHYQPVANPQPIMIARVKNDVFGFYHVQSDLADAFRAKGHPVLVYDSEAWHCYADTAPLARFYTH